MEKNVKDYYTSRIWKYVSCDNVEYAHLIGQVGKCLDVRYGRSTLGPMIYLKIAFPTATVWLYEHQLRQGVNGTL